MKLKARIVTWRWSAASFHQPLGVGQSVILVFQLHPRCFYAKMQYPDRHIDDYVDWIV